MALGLTYEVLSWTSGNRDLKQGNKPLLDGPNDFWVLDGIWFANLL